MNKQTGITIIGLTITIIVILILAAVTVTTLTGDNGLLVKTNDAKIVTEKANLEEEVQLAFVEYEAGKYINSEESLEDKMRFIFEKIHGEGNITIFKIGKNYKVNVKSTKTAYIVRNDGKLEKYEKMEATDVYGKIEGNTLKLFPTQNVNSEYTKIDESSACPISNYFMASSIEYVEIEEPIAPIYTSSMFNSLSNLKEIKKIENLHTENTIIMNSMFKGCTSLETLNLSNFDTSNVTDMNSMFKNCSDLTSIDLSNFDTSNVTDMGNMFDMPDDHKSSKLKSVILGKEFQTSKVTNMNYMFIDCGNLETIYVARELDTSKVNNSVAMFQWCYKLTGGNGTQYNNSYINKTYAKIDKVGQQGYFTYKSLKD